MGAGTLAGGACCLLAAATFLTSPRGGQGAGTEPVIAEHPAAPAHTQLPSFVFAVGRVQEPLPIYVRGETPTLSLVYRDAELERWMRQ